MSGRRFKKGLKRISLLPVNKYLFFYLENKLKHFCLKLTRSTSVAYPSTIMLELTNHCNLLCSTCPRQYDYGKEMDKGYMKVEQVKKIIDELWPCLDSIGLTGMGETFMYKELEQVADYIKSKNKGIIISVSTNAVMPGFIEQARQLIDKIDTIQVSIDGLDSVYEKIRVNATFREFDCNIKMLSGLCSNSGTTLMLNMVVTKENYFQMPKLIKYSEDIGIDYLDFTLFNLVSVTSLERSYYDFYKSQEFLNTIEESKAAEKNCKGVMVTYRNFTPNKGFRKCPFPWTHYYICWNGYVTPCCSKPFPKEMNFGNVFDNKVIDVLNHYSFKGFRKLWFRNKTPDFCNKCHFIDIEAIR
jgi:radical SAM protein with 4Fe4S-binding SPASM domain